MPANVKDTEGNDAGYTGVFDGNGATINLNVDKSGKNAGLFSIIGDGGKVKNVTTDGKVIGGSYVGGICGTNKGTIDDCNNKADVKAGSDVAGGIAGCCESSGKIQFSAGNHDLIRGDNIHERWSKYHDFLEKFYGTLPSFYNPKDYSLFKEYNDYKIAFVGFNSCEIEKRNMFDEEYISKFEKYIDQNKLNEYGIDKTKVIEVLSSGAATEYDDYGYIPLSQITPIERKVKGLDNYNVIALFHHHFYLFPRGGH